MDSRAGSGVVGEEGIMPTTPSYTLSEALHTSTLWIMFMIYLNVAVCSQLIAIHIVAAAIDEGITPEAAALILTFGGITNTLGRLTIGFLSNRIGNKKALALCLAIQAPALFVLARTHNLYIFYLISAAYTFVYAGVSPIMPTMSASLFGTKSVGSIFGVLNVGFTLGLSIGPLLGGFFYDFTGNYTIAFLFTAIVTTVTFLLCLSMRPPKEREMGS
jgi:OFA family oxalate/formate antiporter-like MFS transporter